MVDIWKFFYQLLSVDFVELVGHVEMIIFVDGVFVVFLLGNGLVAFTEVELQVPNVYIVGFC